MSVGSSLLTNCVPMKYFEHVLGTEEKPEHWEYDKAKILKDDWETYEKVQEHNTALDAVYAALTELAEMILEV